ncbi:DUF5131 family protein [Aquisphaera insulae]|uniref:DUF5131 family protein n=1 Tax=Aquisphaera insulae TaxID=2712864 RepID=UPI0013EAA234|nr:phage Gp37/Gp68 family protein [Aquisphaera insulae]
MSSRSTIEWTDATWNPVRGCAKVSTGCKHCYAETFAERFRGVPGHPYEHGFDLRLVPHKLPEPLTWHSPKTVFVNSMSDLFQERVPLSYVERVCRVMELGDWHTYQVLTKRAEEMRDALNGPLSFAGRLPHVWWGVSVEDRKFGLPRIDSLRETTASVRFLSVEPLLQDLGEINLSGIDWVIVGGESGRGARPMEPGWVLSIRDQCEAAGVAFFFKQWGGQRKAVLGREINGRTYNAMPERQVKAAPTTHDRSRLVETARGWARQYAATADESKNSPFHALLS